MLLLVCFPLTGGGRVAAGVTSSSRIVRNNSSPLITVVSLILINLLFICGVCKCDNGNVAPVGVVIVDNAEELPHTNVDVSADSTAVGNFPVKSSSDVTGNCIRSCASEENFYLNDIGASCTDAKNAGDSCFMARCSKGCNLWRGTLSDFVSCQEACSSPQFYPFDMPCIAGCEMALSYYKNFKRYALEPHTTLAIPVLVEGSLESAALTLHWPVVLPSNQSAPRPVNIQFRYEDFHPSEWNYLAEYDCYENFTCDLLDDLKPYTRYRFRFVLPLDNERDDVLYSPESEVIRTLAAGMPESLPLITNVYTLDHHRIELFWEAGSFTNGELIGYRLKLWQENSNFTIGMDIEPFHNQIILHDLSPKESYKIELRMLNAEGAGPSAEIVTSTAAFPTQEDNANSDGVDLIIVGEYSIKSQGQEPLSESKLVYQSDHLIRGIAAHLANQLIFVTDSMGVVYRTNIQNAAEREAILLPEHHLKFKATKLTVDWLNGHLYIVGKNQVDNWLIARFDLNGNGMITLVEDLKDQPHHIHVDPVNGFLFWVNSIGIYSFDLGKGAIKAVKKGSHFGAFFVDTTRYLLIIFSTKEKTLIELSFDGSYYNEVQLHGGGDNGLNFHGEVLSLTKVGSTILYLTNGTHMFRGNYFDSILPSDSWDIWPLKTVEWCWEMIPNQAGMMQPIPMPDGTPRHIQVILTSNLAKISWLSPQMKMIQSSAAWQDWEYDLEVSESSADALAIRNIKTLYFTVEKLKPDTEYNFRVRVVSPLGESAGDWSNRVQARTFSLSSNRSFIWASSDGVYQTNEIGENVRKISDLRNVTSLARVNDTLLVVANMTLRSLNLKTGPSPIGINILARNVAYDWKGGKIYWTDPYKNFVIRADFNGYQRREMLNIFGAKEIRLDSANGFIYYSTGLRVASRPLSGVRFDENDVEYFQVANTYGGKEILSLALDTEKQTVYWIVGAQKSSRCQLYSAGMAPRNNEVHDAPIAEIVLPGSLSYVESGHRLMWLLLNSETAVFANTTTFDIQGRVTPVGLRDIRGILSIDSYTPEPDNSIQPETVDNSTIRIEGSFWNDFNITWEPVATADNYSIFYKVLIDYREGSIPRTNLMESSEPHLRITEFRQPDNPINVSISAYTFWRGSSLSSARLQTPAAAPSQPKRLRIFITRSHDPLQGASNISALLRWDPPSDDTSSQIVAYKVFCWLGDDRIISESFHNLTSALPLNQRQHLEASVWSLQEDLTYTFQVQAFTAGQASGGEKTAPHSVYVSPEMQSVPMVLIATSDFVAELDIDLNRTVVLVHTGSKVSNLRYLQGEQRAFWVNENLELMSYVNGTKPAKLTAMRGEVLALTVDWISRVLYWAEANSELEAGASIYSLDLCRFEGQALKGMKLFTSSSGKQIKDLIVLPFSQALVWLEVHQGSTMHGTLVGKNISDWNKLQLKNGTFLRIFEDSFYPERQTINLVDVKGKICSYDLRRSACAPVKVHYENDETLDITRDAGYIYALRNGTIRAYSRKKQALEYLVQVDDVSALRAFNYQPYPEKKCLLPDYNAVPLTDSQMLIPEVVAVTESSFSLRFPKVSAPPECWMVVPGLKYILQINDASSDIVRELVTHESHLNVTQLTPFSNYSMDLRVSSFYAQRLGFTDVEGKNVIITTAPGTPSVPRNVTAYAISPTEALVRWQEPLQFNSDSVWYQVHWQASNATLGNHIRLDSTFIILRDLEPDLEYSIWVKAFTTDLKFNSSAALQIQTFREPADLQVVNTTPYSMILSWEPSDNVKKFLLEYNFREGNESESTIDITGNSSHIAVEGLEAKTKYRFMLQLTYDVDGEERPYVWPKRSPNRFTFETLGDCPSAPGKPSVEHISGEVFKVVWKSAHPNGAPIEEYSLEALQASFGRRVRREAPIESVYTNKTIGILSQLPWAEELEPVQDKWIVYCNGTELSCIVKDMHTMRLWLFRVRARNSPYGWGPYSANSEPVTEPFVTPDKRNSLVFAIVAPAAIVSTFVIMMVIFRMVQSRRLKAKKLLDNNRHSIWGFDDLVSLQQQIMEARGRNISVISHTLYTGGPLTDGDIALLPQISWNQITLQKFLGSGAFGEVYEGFITYTEETCQDRVAIKTLRKGASEVEKSELLQEAQLMSNFKHDHIVKLIGVCFDTDTISIIMEHMEGGDLLGYLRQSRPNSLPVSTDATLSLADMIAMCADVATGCRYLEDMHFVHRDLACRNCLVSSRNSAQRVVKIGDFGLARDIYKNDYYRKEGEGLLPVRWMPPESLVDGVFTTQSDIWAFGVLCWEILTLGQQPYPARNNFEVLNYVKNCGRLEKPDNCPERLFALLVKCWSYSPEERPSFHYCLEELLSQKTLLAEDMYGLLKDDDEIVNPSLDESFDGDSVTKVPLACKENDEDSGDDDSTSHEVHLRPTLPFDSGETTSKKSLESEKIILTTFITKPRLDSVHAEEANSKDLLETKAIDQVDGDTELDLALPVTSDNSSTNNLVMPTATEAPTSIYYINEGCSRL